jgi:plastocyanin
MKGAAMRTLFATLLLGLVFAASAAPSNGSTMIMIRHQIRGCHAWAVNNGTYKASQTLTLKRGTVVTFMNDDVMPHTLVLTKGPALTFAPAKMGHMGAVLKVTFRHAGVYSFKTRAGEDYPGMGEMKTIGEDNVLRLVVTVR